MQQWHVYEDWTLEEAPRCFYVGKGNDDRVEKLKRSNCYHREISSELGQCRVVVASSSNEDQILEIERKIISERHTYVKDPEYNGIGCNLTKGGQGNSGRVVTLETRQKISQSKLCKTPNRIWTQEDRNAVSERMSRLHKGKKLTDDHLNILKERMANPDIKKEMINKVSHSIKEKYKNDLEFKDRIIQTRVRGEDSRSPFTNEEVLRMRSEWEQLDRTTKGNKWSGPSPSQKFCRDWAELKRTSVQAIYAIVTRKTWRHLP